MNYIHKATNAENECTVQYSDEQNYLSKIATENGLVALGIAMAQKQQEIDKFEEIKKKLNLMVVDIKADPENDHTVADTIVMYMSYVDKELELNRIKLSNLDDEYQTLTEESDDLLTQLEEIEIKEKKLIKDIGIKNKMIYRREKIIEFLLILCISMYLYIAFMHNYYF